MSVHRISYWIRTALLAAAPVLQAQTIAVDESVQIAQAAGRLAASGKSLRELPPSKASRTYLEIERE